MDKHDLNQENEIKGRMVTADKDEVNKENRDISEIDRQEGAMDHGTTGGDMKTSVATKDNKSSD